MKIKKRIDFLNEAAGWPPGSVALVTSPNRLGVYQGGWGTFVPNIAKGAEGGVFYMKIENSGKIWIEGPMVAGNCIKGNLWGSMYRAHKDSLQKPGPEYSIFMKDKIFDSGILNKTYFVDGKEKGLMNVDGTAASVDEGRYIARSLNFTLTVEKGETVIFFEGEKRSTSFCAAVSDVASFSSELSKEQKEVIADWFSTQLGGADITVSGNSFSIAKWFIKAARDSSKGYPNSFSAGPFVSKKQADEILASILKLNEYSLFDPSTAKIEPGGSYDAVSLTIEELIEWAKTVGVKTTMKELLTIRKGAVTGKKFGL